MIKIVGDYKAPLSKEVQKVYNMLAEVIAEIPEPLRIQKTIHVQKTLDSTGGKISVADLVAYQIGWGKLLIGWYEAGLAGQKPDMPGEGFSKWDYAGLAKHFYQKYHYEGSVEQNQKFHEVVNRILEIVETEYQKGHLDALGVWGWCTLQSGKQWPLSKWIRVNTVAPYKRAAALIKNLYRCIFSIKNTSLLA